MKITDKLKIIIDYFLKTNPNPKTELIYDSPYELLISVILSAQCTDKRVNQVTPKLFSQFPDFSSLSKADFDKVFSLIKSISYPNNKTTYLIKTAQIITQQFNGELPLTLDTLIKLPGVGRKTANVITSILHHQPNLAVDTHVFKVSHRLKLVPKSAKTVLAVEKYLIAKIPQEFVAKLHHWLILHGRYICLAQKPKCSICPFTSICSYYNKKNPV